MSGIEGAGRISPEDKAIYKNQFERSVKLFQKSLAEYEKADFPAKKEEFKKVMEKCLTIMNETAQAVLGDQGHKQKDRVQQDFNKLIAQDTPANANKLNNDIEKLKDYIA